VKLIYLGLNLRFNMCVIFTVLSMRGDVPVDSDVFLMIDFVNLKIKPTQSFRGAYKSKMRVFIEVNTRTYMSIYICSVFLKNEWLFRWCLSQSIKSDYSS
jgi:hypothetical protein